MSEKLRGVVERFGKEGTFSLQVRGGDWFNARYAVAEVKAAYSELHIGDVVELGFERKVSSNGDTFRNLSLINFIEAGLPSPIAPTLLASEVKPRDTRDAAYWKRHETQIVKQSCLKAAAAITARQAGLPLTEAERLTIVVAEHFKDWVLRDA